MMRINAGSDLALQQQINAEKQRVLGTAGETRGSESLISHRSVVVNGDFSLGELGGPPQGWTPAYPTGSAKLVADGAEQRAAPGNYQSRERGCETGRADPRGRPVPSPSRTDARQALQLEKPSRKASCRADHALRIHDAKDQMLPPSILTSKTLGASAELSSAPSTWPVYAKSIEVVVRCVFAEGTFDFDDVSLEFK